MNKNLRDYILDKIALKQEGASWDFKRQWYSAESKCDLLHDIVCMANLTEHCDGYIIIGVDEENDYSVTGVENDANRRNTQSLVTFLRDKDFASGIRPVVHVETLNIGIHLVDVIVVEDSTNTPYYLSSNFQGVKPFHIYTRIQDTNTDITKSADPDIIEKLWRKRFGIDRTALDRAFLYLKHPEAWLDIDDETGWFYKYAPEFTVHYELIDLTGYEYYHCTQTDPTPAWYDIIISYHQTVIYKQEGVSMDGGRYLTACPHFDVLDVKSPAVKLSYYIESDEDYILFEFFNEKYLLKNDRLAQRKFLEIVPIFSSELEKNRFWEYAQRHFYQLRPKYNYKMLPPFAEHVSSGQSIDALKEEFLDAMVCMTLLRNFREQATKDTFVEEDETIKNGEKHQAELTAVSEKIYDLAANEIQAYINKTYGDKQKNTLAQQLEDFHVIADEVAAYLMGNAMAMIDETCWADDLKTLNGHIRHIAEYVASNQKAELGPKNYR